MLLSVNENDNRPIYLQIVYQIKEQVSNGMLHSGDELPSVRELADSLGINMHTVRSAYLKLREQGIITMHLGRRAKIAKRTLPFRSPDLTPELEIRLKELFSDALLSGMSPDELSKLVNQKLGQLKKE